MTFDEWWEKNEAQYSSDACHMSEYHMAFTVWNAALAVRPEGVATAWVATSEKGSVLHFSKADGWQVEIVSSGGPQEER